MLNLKTMLAAFLLAGTGHTNRSRANREYQE